MKLKSFYSILIFGSIIIGLPYLYFFIILGGIPFITLKHNTVYSQNFSEEKFDQISIGDEYQKLTKSLGSPLLEEYVSQYSNKKNYYSFELFAYTSSQFSQYPLHFRDYISGGPDYLEYYFVLDYSGNVIRTKKIPGKYSESELFKMDRDEIIMTFGLPNSYIKVDSVKKILFTNLVDGPYLGKQPTFKERGVYLNKDLKVIQIINKN